MFLPLMLIQNLTALGLSKNYKKMTSTIPPELTIGAFSVIGVLTGYIWNSQSKRIDKISEIQKNLPCNIIHLKITEMRNDIKWIKESIKKEKWQN